MSAFIGNVKGPRHNSPNDAAEVWCSPGAVELILHDGPVERPLEGPPTERDDVMRGLDPIAARNLAALLVRASEEAELMALKLPPDRNAP